MISKLPVGCVIMASGVSRRFGSNKLFAEFQGRTLLERVLELTEGDLFARRIVVTRTPEVAEICRKKEIEVILHELPGRNDAIRLGVEALCDMKGILFCPCDQPLLRRESLERMLQVWRCLRGEACRFRKEGLSGQEEQILRLSYGEQGGSPLLFGSAYFSELCQLPDKRGGSYVAAQYPDRVRPVPVGDRRELMDVDTKEDLEALLEAK